jgi:hypothetical protein
MVKRVPKIEKTTEREKNPRLGPYALNLAPYFIFFNFRHFSAL